jgi:hypothetical protein
LTSSESSVKTGSSAAAAALGLALSAEFSMDRRAVDTRDGALIRRNALAESALLPRFLCDPRAT